MGRKKYKREIKEEKWANLELPVDLAKWKEQALRANMGWPASLSYRMMLEIERLREKCGEPNGPEQRQIEFPGEPESKG